MATKTQNTHRNKQTFIKGNDRSAALERSVTNVTGGLNLLFERSTSHFFKQEFLPTLALAIQSNYERSVKNRTMDNVPLYFMILEYNITNI